MLNALGHEVGLVGDILMPGCQRQYNWRGGKDLQSICDVAGGDAIVGIDGGHTTRSLRRHGGRRRHIGWPPCGSDPARYRQGHAGRAGALAVGVPRRADEAEDPGDPGIGGGEHDVLFGGVPCPTDFLFSCAEHVLCVLPLSPADLSEHRCAAPFEHSDPDPTAANKRLDKPRRCAQVADKAGVTDAGLDHFYKVMRAMGQWEMLDEPSPKVTLPSLNIRSRYHKPNFRGKA